MVVFGLSHISRLIISRLIFPQKSTRNSKALISSIFVPIAREDNAAIEVLQENLECWER